jgi:hypothetical protein
MDLIAFRPVNGPVSVCGFSIVPGPEQDRYVILHDLPENPGLPAAVVPGAALESLLDAFPPHRQAAPE